MGKYSIAESIEDETTLPIRHMMAPSEMTVPAGQLDREFFALAEMEGVTDVDKLNQVLDRVVGLRTFLTADDRIEKVAEFVAQHFLLRMCCPSDTRHSSSGSTAKRAPSTSGRSTSCCRLSGACRCTRRIPVMSSKGRSLPSFSFPRSRRRTSGLPSRRQTTCPRYS